MAVKDIVKGICNLTRCKYDVYTKEKIDEMFSDICITGELIYTNDDVNQSFEGKKIKISSEYKYIDIISYIYPTTGSKTIVTRVYTGNYGTINYADYNANVRAWERTVTYIDALKEINFGNATINGATDNNGLVPYQIIGYK